MYYEQDYILRQIEILVQGIRRVFFGKQESSSPAALQGNELPSTMWYARVLERLEAGDINGAENLLFAELDPEDPKGLFAALDFYERLRRLPEEQLHACGFSLQEVEQGLLDAARLYGLDLGEGL